MKDGKSSNLIQQIECGGKLIQLVSGKFTYLVEISVGGHLFGFDTPDTFETKDGAEGRANQVMDKMPDVIARAASYRDFQIFLDFCALWNLSKIEEVSDLKLTGTDLLH